MWEDLSGDNTFTCFCHTRTQARTHTHAHYSLLDVLRDALQRVGRVEPLVVDALREAGRLLVLGVRLETQTDVHLQQRDVGVKLVYKWSIQIVKHQHPIREKKRREVRKYVFLFKFGDFVQEPWGLNALQYFPKFSFLLCLEI